MQEHSDKFKEQLRYGLAKNARDYLHVGLKLLHDARRMDTSGPTQAAIGNLGIAIELMLKALVASLNPILLFTKLPEEIQAYFASPETLPTNFNWLRHEIDLKSVKRFKTVGFRVVINFFYTYFPQHKQLLEPYFAFVAETRNQSVHAALPTYQKYDLERVGYLALSVADILKGTSTYPFSPHNPTDQDSAFLRSYNVQRIDRVRKQIEAAMKRAQTLQPSTPTLQIYTSDKWTALSTTCSICHSPAMLTGYTDFSGSVSEEGDEYADLDFLAETFACCACGLQLNDAEELEQAGVPLSHDRSEDIEAWLKEHTGPHFDDDEPYW